MMISLEGEKNEGGATAQRFDDITASEALILR